MPTLTPKSTMSLLAPIVISWPVPAPSMVELAAKTRVGGLSCRAELHGRAGCAFGAYRHRASAAASIHLDERVCADVEVATVHAYGVPLGMVVVELTESLISPPLNTGVPAKVGDVAKTNDPLPVASDDESCQERRCRERGRGELAIERSLQVGLIGERAGDAAPRAAAEDAQRGCRGQRIAPVPVAQEELPVRGSCARASAAEADAEQAAEGEGAGRRDGRAGEREARGAAGSPDGSDAGVGDDAGG